MARTYVDPYRDVYTAQNLAREGVQAFGEQLRPELLREIGATLGGLNEIGALRSGGTQVALRDLTQTYADRIGAAARGATLDAMGLGLSAGQLRLDQRRQQFAEEEAERQRRGALRRAVGSVLGAGVGFVAGPALGAVGSKLGERIASRF